jgi:hypothetical protein
MVNSQKEIELISHCIEFMSNKASISELYSCYGLPFRDSYSYSKLAGIFESNPNAFSLADLTALFRSKWMSCDIERHYKHLKSGLLRGHDWHGAMPSFLHRCIQDRVRECCEGNLSLEKYLSIGNDIFKHEYFMVATHDICESYVILAKSSIIPPIGNKSVSDFIYDNIPYDLKVSSHPPKWQKKAGKMTIEEKKQLAYELYEGADKERMRKVADACKNNWGLNRMYYLVADQEKWLQSPENTVSFLTSQLSNPDNYFDIVVHELSIHICLVEQ